MSLTAISPWARTLTLLGWAGATGLWAAQAGAAAPDELAKKIETLTGGRTKIVWEGGTHLPDNAKMNNPIHGGTGGLIGYDTADGKSRVLSTSSNWMMPFITPDGSAVIFNLGRPDQGGNPGCKIVNWDGSNERWLVQGEYGWAHCAWVDPKTKIVWIYVSDANRNGWGVDKCAFTKVFRVRLDKPEVRELIYETKRGGLWLFATPDGKRLWGSLRDSQEQSLLDIATKTVMPVSGGCDPSHSPTANHFFTLTGTHRHVLMFDWKKGQVSGARNIQVNTMPGVDGRENVWHPRWSTHPQLFTIMGPEHGAAQIYLGRFNKALTAVDGWVQITDNKQWNGWSHAWVDYQPEPIVEDAPAIPWPASWKSAWPMAHDDLVFAWRNGNNIANPILGFDSTGKPLSSPSLNYGARRHLGPYYELILGGVPAEMPGAATFAADRIARAGELTILAGILPPAFSSSVSRRLVSLQANNEPVFAIEQLGGNVNITVGDAWQEGPAKTYRMIVLSLRIPTALAVTAAGEWITVYVNGKGILRQQLRWTPTPLKDARLVFGDDVKQAAMDAPRLESVATYARALSLPEIVAESRRYNEEVTARPAIPRLRLKGKLVRMAPVPDAAKIEPYTQALVVGEYEVISVLQGEYQEKTVNVAHWGMLNRQPQPIAGRKVGDAFELLLEPFGKQPQLEPEYLSDTDREPGGALYYDVEK